MGNSLLPHSHATSPSSLMNLSSFRKLVLGMTVRWARLPAPIDSCHFRSITGGGRWNVTVDDILFIYVATPSFPSSFARYSAFLTQKPASSIRPDLSRFRCNESQRAIEACPLRDPMIVVSVELRYSIFVPHRSICSRLVTTTPHGRGQPSILCPDTDIESAPRAKDAIYLLLCVPN